MVVNVIITGILDSGMGYRDEEFYVLALFYADYVLLLARLCVEAESMIGVVVGVTVRYGISINNGKSNVLLYVTAYTRIYRIPAERVGEISMANIVRYLGTDLGNSRKYYNTYKKGRLVQPLYSVVSSSRKEGKLGIICGI